MSCKETAGGIGIGLLLGAAAGAIVGILYAPHSGRVTRGLMDEKLHEATRKAEEIVHEARDRAEDILKKAHLRKAE